MSPTLATPSHLVLISRAEENFSDGHTGSDPCSQATDAGALELSEPLPPPYPLASTNHTDELVTQCRQGWLIPSRDGTITNPRNGAVYGTNRDAKSRYYVINSGCPVRKLRFTAYLHRVIWVYYNGPIELGMQVNHKDGDTKNNRLENLELITPSQNTQHAVASGAMHQKLGTPGALALRLRFVNSPELSKKSLEREFAISGPMVTRVLKNTAYPSDDATAVAAALLHEVRFPTGRVLFTGKNTARIEAVLEQIRAGDIMVDPETPDFRGIRTNVTVYAPRKTMKYAMVSIKLADGKYVNLPAHRVMWSAFHGVPPVDKVVHHLNADKGDFRLSNLELTTGRANLRHAAAAGSQEHSKLNEVIGTQIRESFLRNPRSAGAMCKEYGISQRTMRTLLQNQTHQHGDSDIREEVSAVYEGMTASWRAGPRGRAGTSRPAAPP